MAVAVYRTPSYGYDIGKTVLVEVGNVGSARIPINNIAFEVLYLEVGVELEVALAVVEVYTSVVVCLAGYKEVDKTIAVEVGWDDV